MAQSTFWGSWPHWDIQTQSMCAKGWRRLGLKLYLKWARIDNMLINHVAKLSRKAPCLQEEGQCKISLWTGCGSKGGWRIGAINEINLLQSISMDVVVHIPPICKICSDPFISGRAFRLKALTLFMSVLWAKLTGHSQVHVERYTTPFTIWPQRPLQHHLYSHSASSPQQQYPAFLSHLPSPNVLSSLVHSCLTLALPSSFTPLGKQWSFPLLYCEHRMGTK